MIFKIINSACKVKDKLDNEYLNILSLNDENKRRFNVKCYEWETIPVENEKISNLEQRRAIVYVSLETLEDFVLLRNALNCDIISFNRNGEEYLEIYDDYIE